MRKHKSEKKYKLVDIPLTLFDKLTQIEPIEL